MVVYLTREQARVAHATLISLAKTLPVPRTPEGKKYINIIESFAEKIKAELGKND